MTRAVAAGALLASPCSRAQPSRQPSPFVPVTDEMLANPDPADWLMINRTFDEQRYSPLDQINKSNVGQLRMAWSRGLPNGTQESTPIVHRGVMYLYAPGAAIQAIDATNGDLIWEYTRNYPKEVTPTAARNKSLGIYEDMIYFAAPDGFLVALDAKTGKLRWETKVDNGGQTAGGLLVADGKVISNRTCEQSKRENCFIAAHDAKTGREVWKFFVTAAPGEPGGDTWGNVPVEQRAAGPWGLPGSYDPKRKVLYWGIANPNPYTRLTRHGSADAVSLTAPAESLQQLDGRARCNDRQAPLVLPGAAGRRLGCRPQSRAHAGAHESEPRSAAGEMDQLGARARPRARHHRHRRRGRRHVRARAGDRRVPVGAAVPL